MSLLQFILIIAAVVFILFGVDLYKRRKMNALHFIIFFFGGGLIILFALDTSLLNRFGSFFGVARGADLLVYVSLILLFYFYIDLINRHTKDKMELTRLISSLAIQEGIEKYSSEIQAYQNSRPEDNVIFHCRVFNESFTIGESIDEIIGAGYHKILFINDGSTDDSMAIIEEKRKQYPKSLFIVLSHSMNRGFGGGGAANKTGFQFITRYADILRVQWIVTFDIDGQHDAKDLPKFLEAVKKDSNLDLVLGSRFIAGGMTQNMPSSRKVILFISKIVTRIFYSIQITDPHNGFRMFSKHALGKMKITADNMHYANEINESIKKNKLHFAEVPVTVRYTTFSLKKGQKNSNSIKLAMEMIYKKLFFR